MARVEMKMKMISSNPSVNEAGCFEDRAKAAMKFDQTKAGVKGLLDAGVEKIPSIFIHQPESRAGDTTTGTEQDLQILMIDLKGIHGGGRSETVEEVKEAAREWGFFQIVNHGVPFGVMKGLLEGVRRFHEQPSETKEEFYTREFTKRVTYYSTGTLHINQTAHWRDSLSVDFPDGNPDPEGLPPVCREAFVEYVSSMVKLRDVLSELFSEALGLGRGYLSEKECMEDLKLVCHYYPAYPEPDLTMGITKHSDPYFLTVLLQDSIGGLQILHHDRWVDVHPVEGAFVINLGDFMQLITNDKFKSVEHRVVARRVGPRLSAASLLFPSVKNKYKTYGPHEYFLKFASIGLDGTQGLPHFRL
ncbi:1-aminocyclopropane-1-carboxylate oxidase homolog 12-like [Diospyros lotus]|uniref:1-aminocyclopropane-1-carboxylate oxidase homolog 12-like n=1 Tax=Diospyros lotus TaxID=55363 RepID=UPI00225A1D3D|nr:1-aminocyclopropane-1-carboxylate oxidase homolog 12-like [Diospyros lotus]